MFSINVNEKIRISLLNQIDSQTFFKLMKKNYEYLGQFMPRIFETKTVEDTKIVIKKFLVEFANNNGFKAGIYYEDVLVGVCGFKYIDWYNKKTELMYWIDENFSGRGIVSKCVLILSEIAFKDYSLNKVIIKAREDNTASRKVAEKCDFHLEGKILKDEFANGKFNNIYIYGKFKDKIM